MVFSLLAETPHELHFYWKCVVEIVNILCLDSLTVVRMSAWADLALFTLTFVLCIVWSVEVGVVVSLIVSLLMVVHRSSKTRLTILVRFVLLLHRPLHFDCIQRTGSFTWYRPLEAHRRDSRCRGRSRRPGDQNTRQSRLRYGFTLVNLFHSD